MTQLIDSILDIADRFDAIVFDQWGVLHDGTQPYPRAIQTLEALRGRRLGVVSNSGKRSAPNAARIGAMGFDAAQFDPVMTSGEALWRRLQSGKEAIRAVYPIEGRAGDAALWAQGLDLAIVSDVGQADAVLLMGLPDGADAAQYQDVLSAAFDAGLPLYCSNPDLTSPRGGGTYVMSPGALAQLYDQKGGTVHLFGKPHGPIFDAMQSALDVAPERILMVGDSLHHDILGAQDAGWASLLIRAGVHAPNIGPDIVADIGTLAAAAHTAPPTFSLNDLR